MITALLVALVQCPDGSPPPCAQGRVSRSMPTVAVLYFDNMSRDSNDAYLADGLTEQTIAQLGRIDRLTVSSRYAVRRFRGAEVQDPASVGRSLNAAFLVTGSIRRSGSRLRVGVELLRSATGVRVWGEQYDRTTTDLLSLQDDIASAVATGIVGQLLPGERSGLRAASTRNSAAYDQFLRGNFHLARRNAADLLRALRSYQSALDADPAFTDAIARIAYVYALAVDNETDIGLPRDTLVARGVAFADRAIRSDSLSSDAWLAAAYIRMGQYPATYEGVRERFRRAIALNPRSAEAHHQFAAYLDYWGDSAAAREHNLRALELEPGRAITYFQLADLTLQSRDPVGSRRWVDSIYQADSLFALAPVFRFYSSLLLGDTADARSAAEGIQGLEGQRPIGDFFFSHLAALRDSAAAAQMGAGFRQMEPGATKPGTAIFFAFAATALAMAGNADDAIAVLRRAEPRGVRVHDVMRMPMFDAIRNRPEFQRLWNETRAPGMPW